MKEITAYQTSDGEIHASIEKAQERETAITTGKFKLELNEFIRNEFNDKVLSDNEMIFIKSNIVKLGKVIDFRRELIVKYNINI